MVSNKKDSQGFENSYNSYEQYPLEKFFIFTIYQNYTLALIMNSKCLELFCLKPSIFWEIYKYSTFQNRKELSMCCADIYLLRTKHNMEGNTYKL